MIRKVYEVDPMVCPQCGGTMKVIAFLTDYAVVDRIINHLKLTLKVPSDDWRGKLTQRGPLGRHSQKEDSYLPNP